MEITKIVSDMLFRAYKFAKENNDEYITPEHLVYSALENDEFKEIITKCGGDIEKLKNNLEEYIREYVTKIENSEPEESFGVKNIFYIATQYVIFSGKKIIGLEHIIASLFSLEESYGVYFIEEQGITKRDLLINLCHEELSDNFVDGIEIDIPILRDELEDIDINLDGELNIFDDAEDYSLEENNKKKSILEAYTINLTELVTKNNIDPLIGREDIIERTIQVLSRRTKNNPIHIGEPGVGKTAITLGLAKLIIDEKVPKKLQGAKIFSLDIGAILAGTKYRGDFEERIKGLLDEIKKHENPIVYIDEIHNIVGAGASNGEALDGSGLLKGYLLDGKIKFIGATTYDEYKKFFEKDKALSRRFQTIEVKEPSIDETIKILDGLKKSFEEFHNVNYTHKALQSAVSLSHKYINDKFLPDKAIDIIDEAGALVSMNSKDNEIKRIDEKIIEEIISKVCNIPKQTVESEEVTSLKNLDNILRDKIFGQNKAIDEVVRCIKMSRAGLNDDNKPVASMLFVGPTGVGKTEIAKTLATTLGIDLVRFDMSEYGEKHSASKLIGSPPGYVGYEEGGILTETIRKKPNCVLLLDEIEKAHSDILSVLLQVMDYATLTDNQGRKADFRNVIIIMTSNAGARNIGKSLVGFGEREIKNEAITDEVKKVFTPEFRNRLDKIIVFNHIDKKMALSIAEKEMISFRNKLLLKNVDMEFTLRCIEFIAEKGVSKEFGAREIIRIINSEIKPLLVDEILFGSLSNGGKCKIDVENGVFSIS